MTEPFDDPDLADVLRAAIAAGLGRVRVSIPAVVVDYNATTQTVTAQVVIRSRYLDENGDPVAYLPKPIANVPVVFPSGNGYAITWPLAAGDPLILVVCDRSIDEWKTTAQEDNTPRARRSFDLSDAVALPGHRAPADALANSTNANAMVIRLPASKALHVGSAAPSDAVALSSAVASVLGTLKTWLDAHVHTSAAAGSPTSPPVVSSPSPASVSSTRIKVDG